MKFRTQASLTLMASLILWPAPSMAQSQLKNDACEPIGRILKSSQQNLVGQLLCRGDQIISKISGSFVLCYFNPSEQQCRPKKRTRSSSNKECPFSSRSLCKRIKGGTGTAQAPRIITPYGRWLLETRPTFSWLAVHGATRYRLEVVDQAKGLWSKTTTTTSLDYPDEQAPLSPENHYKISVIAYNKKVPLVSDSSIFRLIKPADTKELQQMMGLIRSFNLDPDREAYLDLNAAYLSKGVLDESISVLEDRVKAGSNHPDVYRVLAERYLDAGWPDRAREKYVKAIQLATSQNNQIALEKARAGLQALDQYQSQLPDKTKGAQ